MKNARRILAIIIGVCIFGSSIGVMAAKDNIDYALFDLKTFDIMTGDENGNLNLDENITRAEFSKMVVSMIGYPDIQPKTTIFPDVKQDHWASGYIATLNTMNLVKGSDDGKFYPDEFITSDEMCVILVNSLGYNIQAEERGGYPDGYRLTARKIGVLDGVELPDGYITRRDVAIAIYNSLDVSQLVKKYSTTEEYYVDSESTYRKILLKNGNKFDRQTGIVTATSETWLEASITDMRSTQVEIDGLLYECLDAGILKYIGQEIDYYLQDDKVSGKLIIKSYAPTKKNHTNNVDVEDITNITTDKIEYYDSANNGNMRKSMLESDFITVYNGRVLVDYNLNDLLKTTNASLLFIDNNDNSRAEYVFVNEYTSAIVESVNVENKNIYFDKDCYLGDKPMIRLEDENEDIIFNLYSDNGDRITLEDIKEGDVASVLASKDGMLINIMISQKKVEGTLTSIQNGKATISDKEYKFEKDIETYGLQVGSEIVAKQSFADKIVFVENAEKDSDYAYPVKVSKGTGLETAYELMLLIPDKLVNKSDSVEDGDGGADKTVKYLSCQNKAIEYRKLASKVIFQKDEYSSKIKVDSDDLIYDKNPNDNIDYTIMNKPLSYRTNSNGEISSVMLLEQIGKGDKKKYNSSEQTFGGTSGGAYGVLEDTYVVCVPTNTTSSDSDYFEKVEMNNGREYNIKGFELEESKNCAKLIVISDNMVSGTDGIVTTKSDVGMVNEMITAVDEEGEERTKIQMITKGKEIEVMVAKDIQTTAIFNRVR
ncbi:MAG: S-layer homology domain-containing protein, partial [Oscillospiraceae bacterium]